jgi:hypothetical protein
MQVKTTTGPVVLERPKLRDTSTPFTSRLLGKGVSRTNALEALVLSGFVRGLSVGRRGGSHPVYSDEWEVPCGWVP